MGIITDYSKIENFNLAAIEAVKAARGTHKEGEDTGEVVYTYKGRTLKVTYNAFLDSEGKLDYVGITSVDSVRGE